MRWFAQSEWKLLAVMVHKVVTRCGPLANAGVARTSTPARQHTPLRPNSCGPMGRLRGAQAGRAWLPRCTVRPSAQASTTAVAPEVAVLPGTPKDFDVPEGTLIEWGQRLFAANNGIDDDSLLADDFRFEFPVVSLSREEYLKAVRGFKLKDAFPNMTPRAYHWRVDPYEPNRVWFTTRTTGTHSGTLNFGPSKYEATGQEYYSAPECLSYTFNKEGKATSFTGGYIMDRRVGNTGGLGALFGVLHSIGVKIPQPGTLGWTIATTINRINTKLQELTGKKD